MPQYDRWVRSLTLLLADLKHPDLAAAVAAVVRHLEAERGAGADPSDPASIFHHD